MSTTMESVRSDRLAFWVYRLKEGKVPKPERAYVPVEEKYNMVAPENVWREIFARHRCPACGKAFFCRESAWNCHPEASAYEIWNEFAHKGPAGARSLSDAIRAEISNPYGSLGSYGSFGSYGGGPFGF